MEDQQREKRNITSNKRIKKLKSKGLCVCGDPVTKGTKCDKCKLYFANAQLDYNKRHPEKQKRYRRNLRYEVITKYGGKCECCNESNIEFLAIDHKNGDGNIERQKLYGKNKGAASGSWYLKLRREPVREDLRVLCHNCNLSIGFYGYCPHKTPSSCWPV